MPKISTQAMVRGLRTVSKCLLYLVSGEEASVWSTYFPRLSVKLFSAPIVPLGGAELSSTSNHRSALRLVHDYLYFMVWRRFPARGSNVAHHNALPHSSGGLVVRKAVSKTRRVQVVQGYLSWRGNVVGGTGISGDGIHFYLARQLLCVRAPKYAIRVGGSTGLRSRLIRSGSLTQASPWRGDARLCT